MSQAAHKRWDGMTEEQKQRSMAKLNAARKKKKKAKS